jgi:hypothetical protein
MEGDVYGFGVKDVEITEVAEKAGITEVAEIVTAEAANPYTVATD